VFGCVLVSVCTRGQGFDSHLFQKKISNIFFSGFSFANKFYQQKLIIFTEPSFLKSLKQASASLNFHQLLVKNFISLLEI
jgi:hypothetical protein